MKIRAAMMAIAMLFGVAGSVGGAIVAEPAAAQRWDRGPDRAHGPGWDRGRGHHRGWRRSPPRRWHAGPRHDRGRHWGRGHRGPGHYRDNGRWR